MRAMGPWRMPLVRFLLALGLCLLVSRGAWAARLLQVHVYDGDQVILHTCYQDYGTEKPAIVWRYLEHKPIMVAKEDTSIEADDDNPLRATLKGTLRVTISHTTKVLAEASVTELSLTREIADDELWFLPADEVERTAAIAGLPPKPKGLGTTARRAQIAAVVIAAVMIAVALVWFIKRPRSTDPLADRPHE